MYGLLKRDLEYLRKACTAYPEIERVIIFGSRAMGNYKNGSDVDLALVGKGITKSTLYGLHDLLNEEYPLPYFFDVLNYHDIENPKLVEHIDTVGKVIYSKC